MLVLSRKRNQKICIGDDIEIVVNEIRGDRVVLGVQAARSVPVHRREIYERIQAQNNTDDKAA